MQNRRKYHNSTLEISKMSKISLKFPKFRKIQSKLRKSFYTWTMDPTRPGELGFPRFHTSQARNDRKTSLWQATCHGGSYKHVTGCSGWLGSAGARPERLERSGENLIRWFETCFPLQIRLLGGVQFAALVREDVVGGIWRCQPRFGACGLGQGGYSGRYLEAAVKIRSLRPWSGIKIPSLWGCPGRAQWEEFGGGGQDSELVASVI